MTESIAPGRAHAGAADERAPMLAAEGVHTYYGAILVKGRVVFDDTSESLRRQDELRLKYPGV